MAKHDVTDQYGGKIGEIRDEPGVFGGETKYGVHDQYGGKIGEIRPAPGIDVDRGIENVVGRIFGFLLLGIFVLIGFVLKALFNIFRSDPKLGARYGWVFVAVTATILLAAAGTQAAQGMLIPMLGAYFGWDRAAVSFAVAIGLVLCGAGGLHAGSLMERLGPRRLMVGGLLLLAAGTFGAAKMTMLWQLDLFWGILTGLGTGAIALFLVPTVAVLCFNVPRSLVTGVFGAAIAAGPLIVVPLLAWLIDAVGWRTATLALAGCLIAITFVALALVDGPPPSLGLSAYGGQLATTAGLLGGATRTPEFWLLAVSVFVSGATSTGLIGTHFVLFAAEHGYSLTAAARILGLVAAMNIVGMIASGWLTDRYDPRRLLAWCYGLRGLSLILLPFVTDLGGLAIFAIVFGLAYFATVPPTATLIADQFGRHSVGMIFGWIFFAYQLGAALGAYAGGLASDLLGDYTPAFVAAGVLAVIAAVMSLRISRVPAPALTPA